MRPMPSRTELSAAAFHNGRLKKHSRMIDEDAVAVGGIVRDRRNRFQNHF